MSWLAKSIADTLSLSDADEGHRNAAASNPNSSTPSPRGVKEDLSEITQTLSRQFWGVASFLSPPPQSPSKSHQNQLFNPNSDQNVNNYQGFDQNSEQNANNREGFDRNLEENVNDREGFDPNLDNVKGFDRNLDQNMNDSEGFDQSSEQNVNNRKGFDRNLDNREGIEGNLDGNSDDREGFEGVGVSGIRSDLSEIGGRFKSGISKLSENIKVSEITKMATGWREFLEKAVEEMNEEEAKKAVGVSEEVVAFAKDVALHPGTWLDFPLPDDDMEEEFDMSDAQQEHALAVESLAPSLAALRMELCPEYISESSFWKIYFVLIHRILDKEAAVILSTAQVMEARALLTTDLQKHSKVKQDDNLSTSSIDQKDCSNLQQEVSLSVPSGASENITETVVVPISDASTYQKDGSILQHEVSLSVPSGSPENATENVVVPKSDASTDQKDGSSLLHEVSLSGPSFTPENTTQTVVVPKSDASTEAPDDDIEKNSTTSIDIQVVEKSATSSTSADSQTDKQPIAPSDIQIDDKSDIEVEHDNQNRDQTVQPAPSNPWDNGEEEEEDHDDWLREEISELDAATSKTTIPIENDDDVSFSDLEDNDEDAPRLSRK
ncbi:hypothetical protein Leryth_010437 [Lithospermum erythrorhizon]|nr:hypothetical protein Leryth_010437 [Lithospermum erythrorhizon]